MASEDVGKLYPVAKAVLTPLFRASWRFDLQGLENIPKTGGAILCPNHTSVLDSFFVPALLPRRVTYVGKAEYMDSWKTKHIFPALGMIPIDREGGDAAERALSAATRVLEKGELFGIYPEGTRSRDGRLYRGHTGPARLALRANVPIIPIGITGARDVMPPDAKFPKLRLPVTIRFGAPISVERYAGRPGDHLVLRQIIDEVMFEIRELSGQEYVNEYANKKRHPAPAATPPEGAPNEGADATANGHGPATGVNGSSPKPAPSEPSVPGSEFVDATDRPSSADILKRPVRRGS
ncbi:1-acyl-sn-glycerol-3-phosphate acyltransferase [Aquihabitans sp. G128]|uniref:lysophospholipid acyltransferase family protein n=1 Tax=Aquihabitans sp. G128 TaxID=2849779 RepID=UPI001C22CC72|nr:lysophospholipid acyltransferase family protein [Aquihabitans sp. G128]QXC61820.1 1-acyl-sn-glycerol-3-phosphate acyltransferase [Aquihabitans sp. G128]